MGFGMFLLISNLLIPVIMVLFGTVFLKRPPKEINGIYGYRTTMSMKNKDTWEFAHRYCGKLWKNAGWFMMAVSLILSAAAIPFGKEVQSLVCGILVTVQTAVLVISIFPVEQALKKNFDSNGNRR